LTSTRSSRFRESERSAPPPSPTRSQAIEPPFTRHGVYRGARRALPVAVSVFAYGLVFGVAAYEAHVTVLEVLLMSSLVVAGAAQFAVVAIWTTPLPVGVIVLTTLVINLRHLLMGAALRPWFGGLKARKAYGSLFFMNDESWALTLADLNAGSRDAAFLLGAGGTIFGAWVTSTVLGRSSGQLFLDPERFGLDFVFVAVFLALLVGLWRGRASIAPWAAAAAAAIVAKELLPGTWYVIAGGVVGTLVGGLVQREAAGDD
jgi:predicted branched-subunit amino acid permease